MKPCHDFVLLQEYMYQIQNSQDQSNLDGAQTPPLAGHLLPPSDCTRKGDENTECEEHIELGSAYEIDHESIPTEIPVQLRSIRVIMVTEKTGMNVSVRYPSIESLKRYFRTKITEMYPEMDERFVMETKLAEKVLCRKIPSRVFTMMKSSADFWLVDHGSLDCGLGVTIETKAPNCLQELKGNEMLRWGVRRKVKFLERHKENNCKQQSSSSIVRGEKTPKQENSEGKDIGVKEEEDYENEEEEEEDYENEEEEEEDYENEEEEEEEAVTDTDESDEKRSCRKRKPTRGRPVRLTKKIKLENMKQKPKKYKQSVLKNPQDRWSVERYKMAEKNLLEVMKAKGAVYGNPVLRPDLRTEARKRIGDTGLLDHLLKQMAGRVAPGGKERFRRRHNAEGAMEYWLENADLVDIRREAGVEDSYWTPPPGWNPGDCPTQDPVCSKELKLLNEVTANLQIQIDQLVPRKLLEEELAKLKREMMELVVIKRQELINQAIVVHSTPMGHQYSSMVTHQPVLHASLDTNEKKCKEQLMLVSNDVMRMEEEMGKLKRSKEEMRKEVVEAETESGAEKEKKQMEDRNKTSADEEEETVVAEKKKKKSAEEEKTAKLERLKSGFRICKPQGSFLWPNMGSSSSCKNNNTTTNVPGQFPHNLQVMRTSITSSVQLDNMFLVGGGPPSVSSSSARPILLLQQQQQQPLAISPVRPLAERRAFSVRHEKWDSNYSNNTTSSSSSSIINLNNLPAVFGEGLYTTHTTMAATAAAATTHVMVPSSNINPKRKLVENGRPAAVGGRNWLALGTPNIV